MSDTPLSERQFSSPVGVPPDWSPRENVEIPVPFPGTEPFEPPTPEPVPSIEGTATIEIKGLAVMDLLASMLAALAAVEDEHGLTPDQGAALEVKDGIATLRVSWSVR